MDWIIPVGIGVLAVLLLLLICWRRVPADKAMVITGLRKRVLVGRGGFVIPILETSCMISLEAVSMTTDITEAPSKQGIFVDIAGTAVVKVDNQHDAVLTAVEQFCNGNTVQTTQNIKTVVEQILEGKLRGIVSTLTVEQINEDRVAFENSIEDSIKATATLLNGETYEVERVLYYDTGIDIAVIKVSRTNQSRRTTSAFNHLDLVGTADIRPGDPVYAIGNPLGLGLAISSGIIGSTAHELDRYALPCIVNSADISRGSSGGALMNAHGQVIGVTSGAYTYGNNMYLAVPVDPVMAADLTVSGWTLKEVKAIEAAKDKD